MHTPIRFTVTLINILVSLTLTSHSAEKRKGDTSKYKNITLLRSSDVPASVSDRVASHVKASIPVTVSQLTKTISGGELEGKIHVANAKAMHEKGSPLLIVVGNIKNRPERVIISKRDNVALINVGGFQAYLKQPDKITDECLKRIDRASMKAVGTLFGLESCQNPFCAMSDLEAKPHIPIQGRNYCPVCLPAYEEKVGLAPVLNKKPATKKKSSGK